MLIDLKLMKNYVKNDEKNKTINNNKTADNTQTHNVGTIFFLSYS